MGGEPGLAVGAQTRTGKYIITILIFLHFQSSPFRIDDWVGLHQEARPASHNLVVESVGVSYEVVSPGLYEESLSDLTFKYDHIQELGLAVLTVPLGNRLYFRVRNEG